MKAIVQDEYGPAEGLELRDIDKPEIKDEEVLIRVHAAGVNVADWAVMSGLPYVARPVYGLRKPKNPVRGTDVAGTVEAVGTGVTRFQRGDAVFGEGVGSFAEYATAPEEKLAPKPANLSFEQAGAVPMAGLVAHQALRDHGDVRAGQKVLINGASGGIGTFAVQIAKSLGAEVTGVCSTRNVDMVRSLGADHVIDYTHDDFTQKDHFYDFILDNVANHSMSELRRALTPTGTLVPNGGGFDNLWFASGGRVINAQVKKRFVSHKLRPFLVSMKFEDLAPLKELIEDGVVMPVIDRTYPLSDASQAIRHVGEGHTRGKVVITI
ncbi:MAG: NAD(P)-dependent alcohol dehydrogenase [Actinomycetota bacterium]|nr:NAD(P)-dependent alcohol dehydrogenase [Actinomycetota bacterium]